MTAAIMRPKLYEELLTGEERSSAGQQLSGGGCLGNREAVHRGTHAVLVRFSVVTDRC